MTHTMIDTPPLDNTQLLPPKLSKQEQKKVTGTRTQLYRLRNQSGKIIGGRQCKCGKTPIKKDSGLISVIKKENSYYYGGLLTCGSVWTCPVCALKITKSKSEKLLNVLSLIQKENKYSIGFLTLTTRHNYSEKCKDVKNRLLQAWRNLTKQRKYRNSLSLFQIVGEIRSLEVKFSFKNGFHPHLHILFISKDNEENLKLFAKWIIEKWTEILNENADSKAQKYIPVLNYKGITEYITKMTAAQEMTKIHTKTHTDDTERFTPFEILNYIEKFENSGILHDEEKKIFILKCKFKEYAEAFKGSKHVTYSKSLLNLYGDLLEMRSDQDITKEKQENEELKFSIQNEIFRKIVKYEIEAEILNIAQFEKIEEIISFLSEYGIFCIFENEILKIAHTT